VHHRKACLECNIPTAILGALEMDQKIKWRLIYTVIYRHIHIVQKETVEIPFNFASNISVHDIHA
jgi:hypothetical protein